MPGFRVIRDGTVAYAIDTNSLTEARTLLLLQGMLPHETNFNLWIHPYDTHTAELFSGLRTDDDHTG